MNVTKTHTYSIITFFWASSAVERENPILTYSGIFVNPSDGSATGEIGDGRAKLRPAKELHSTHMQHFTSVSEYKKHKLNANEQS